MNQLTPRPKERSVTMPKKSITGMSVKELNEIDKFQNINRGFMDDDKYRRLSSWR